MPAFSIVHFDSKAKSIIVGSGPYIPKYDNSTLFLTRNEEYTGKIPFFNIIRVDLIQPNVKVKEINNYDLSFPFIGKYIDIDKIPKSHQLSKVSSLSYNHLFFNLNRKYILKNKEFRRDFSKTIMTLAKLKKNKAQFSVPQNHFLPYGIMPETYYLRKKNEIEIKDFIAKWKGKVSKKERIDFITIEGQLSDALIDDIRDIINKVGLVANIKFVSAQKSREILINNEYDIVRAGYLAPFPDLDAFLDPFEPNSKLQYGSFETKPLLDKIASVRHLDDPDQRLNYYTKYMLEFENHWYIVPLYRLQLPIIHRKEIVIPDTNFRFATELWSLRTSKHEEGISE